MARANRPHVYLAALAALTLGALFASSTQAHKAITSRYTYNEHVFPILRDRCARCHYEGGPTPMSLMTYKEAIPWAESMREQLVGEKMPPWYADPTGPAVKGGHPLGTKELDILVTWAVGGTPQGEIGKDPPPYAPPPSQWRNGTPDLEVKMDAEHTLPAGTMEEDFAFTLPTGLKEEKWVKAVDLQPGTISMVRDAVISIDKGPVLAAWVPGHDATPTPNGVAFRLPAGAKLNLKIHYKKHWQDEQNAKSDRSTIGLYFTDAPLSGKDVQALSLDAPPAGEESPNPRTFSGSLSTGARVVALRPSFDQAYTSVVVDAVLPAGRRVSLLRLRAAQPQWHRRYWLQESIELPKGTKVEVTATPAPHDDFAVTTAKRYRLQVAVDYVAQ